MYLKIKYIAVFFKILLHIYALYFIPIMYSRVFCLLLKQYLAASSLQVDILTYFFQVCQSRYLLKPFFKILFKLIHTNVFWGVDYIIIHRILCSIMLSIELIFFYNLFCRILKDFFV